MVYVDEDTAVRTARFLFLGGSRHHTWQELSIEDTPSGHMRPVMPDILIARPYGEAAEHYEGRRCVSGLKIWWIYVLAGHEPTPSDIVNGYPYLT